MPVGPAGGGSPKSHEVSGRSFCAGLAGHGRRGSNIWVGEHEAAAAAAACVVVVVKRAIARVLTRCFPPRRPPRCDRNRQLDARELAALLVQDRRLRALAGDAALWHAHAQVRCEMAVAAFCWLLLLPAHCVMWQPPVSRCSFVASSAHWSRSGHCREGLRRRSCSPSRARVAVRARAALLLLRPPPRHATRPRPPSKHPLPSPSQNTHSHC